MSRADLPARRRRGRVLLVGENLLDGATAAQLHQRPAAARNLFQAIGELVTAVTGQPIVAALIDETCLGRHTSRALDAIRHVDPSITLIQVTASAPAEPAPGFDATLSAPINPQALAQILGEDLMLAPPPEVEPPPPEVMAPVPEEVTLPPTETAAPTPTTDPRKPDLTSLRGRSGSPAQTPPEVPGLGDEPARSEPQAPSLKPQAAPPVHARPEFTDGLGDVDLIDAIMHTPEGVTAAALELTRQQTGWNDLDLTEHAPTQRVCAIAPVTVPGQDAPAGHLVTECATDQQLAPWARWLSRWLALDQAYAGYRLMAYRDELTGTWNRRYFHQFLRRTIDAAAARRRPVSVLVFDIDNFKRYNDEFGHSAGDIILRETVALLNSVIRDCDRVCRIGGDEFAVVFADLDAPREAGSDHPGSVEKLALRFQEQVSAMRFPKLGLEAPGTLTISAGLATFPWEGSTARQLLKLADERLMQSKRRGKNHITFGPAAAQPEREENG